MSRHVIAWFALTILAVSAAATPAKPRGFWCARWTGDGGSGSSCARAVERCKRAEAGFAQLGVEAVPCRWQPAGWVTWVPTEIDERIFAERRHCAVAQRNLGGSTCHAVE